MANAEEATLLRGCIGARNLQDETSPTATDNSKAFFILTFMIVGVIGLCYIHCMYVVIRRWFYCPQEDELNEVNRSRSNLHHDGVVFINLNAAQRRAILELIFSETSKVRKKSCGLISEGLNNTRNLGGNPISHLFILCVFASARAL